MDNETAQVLYALGGKIEQYGGELAKIAAKQASVRITQNLLLICTMAFAVLVIYKLYKRYQQEAAKTGDYSTQNNADILRVLLAGSYILALFFAYVCISDILQWYFNPDYAAIQEMVNLAQSLKN
jgi:Na+/alanine symporter